VAAHNVIGDRIVNMYYTTIRLEGKKSRFGYLAQRTLTNVRKDRGSAVEPTVRPIINERDGQYVQIKSD
jgi:hypothetical protein